MDKSKYILTDEQRNDPKFMKKIIGEDYTNMYELGSQLKLNPEFMQELLKYVLHGCATATKHLHRKLSIYYDILLPEFKQDTNLLLQIIDEICKGSKNNAYYKNSKECYRFLAYDIDPTILIGNKDFWKAIEQKGLMLDEYKYYRDLTAESFKARQKNLLEKNRQLYENTIGNLREQGKEPDEETLAKFNETISSTLLGSDSLDVGLMIELAKLDSSVLSHIGDELKDNRLFLATAKLTIPEASKYLDLDFHFERVRNSCKSRYARRLFILEHVDEIDESNVNTYLTRHDKEDEEFLLDLIEIDSKFYKFACSNLRKNKRFQQRALEVNPDVEHYIDDYNSKNKQQKEESKKHIEIERERALREEYETLGDKHPKLVLVRDFIGCNTSKKIFIRSKHITEKELDDVIKEVTKIYPELKEQIETRNKVGSAIYVNRLNKIIHGLNNGQMTVLDYARGNFGDVKLNRVLENKSYGLDKLDHIRKMVLNSMASGELRMMDYIRLFVSETSSNKYTTAMSEIYVFLKRTRLFIPELREPNDTIYMAYQNVTNLEKYAKPYKESNFLHTKRGFINPATGEPEMVVITEEHISYAKKYLKIIDEYLCANTMGETLNKLIRGEISKEEIDERYNQMFSSLEQKKMEKDDKNAELNGLEEEIQSQEEKANYLKQFARENNLSLDRSAPNKEDE